MPSASVLVFLRAPPAPVTSPPFYELPSRPFSIPHPPLLAAPILRLPLLSVPHVPPRLAFAAAYARLIDSSRLGPPLVGVRSRHGSGPHRRLQAWEDPRSRQL